MDACSIVIFSITGSCCLICICMYCIQINDCDNCCNRRSFCHSAQVSNMSSDVVIQEPGLPKYGEEIIYNEDIIADENRPPPPEYVP